MDNLVYNRVVTLSRGKLVKDADRGAVMERVPYATDVPASIQPKRDRNISSSALPSGVSSTSMDAMTTWKIFIEDTSLGITKGDIATDDLGTSYIVELSYPTGYGFHVEARIDRP